MAYLSILDGVRSVAILLVVVCHLVFQVLGGKSPRAYDLNAFGHLGVAIFFVHTTWVLLASLERHGSGVVPFYVRRLFRIYPLSVTIVLFITLIQLVGSSPIDLARLLSNLFLVQNLTGDLVYIGPLWSLSHEVQMYLFLPILYLIITRTKHPVLCCFLLYFTSAFLASIDPGNLGRFHVNNITASSIRYAPCFAAGALAFALSGRIPKALHPAGIAIVLVVGIVFIPLLVRAGVPETPLAWAFCLALAIIIPASRELSYRPIVRASRTVATYSYGVYLTHIFALGAVEDLMPGPPIVQWAAMLVLLVGLPYVCYHGIEKRGVALGARLAARLGGSKGKNLHGAAKGDQASSL